MLSLNFVSSYIFGINYTQECFGCLNYRMDYGEWSENSRGTYNKWDGIARTTAQVPSCLVSLYKQLRFFFILVHYGNHQVN